MCWSKPRSVEDAANISLWNRWTVVKDTNYQTSSSATPFQTRKKRFLHHSSLSTPTPTRNSWWDTRNLWWRRNPLARWSRRTSASKDTRVAQRLNRHHSLTLGSTFSVHGRWRPDALEEDTLTANDEHFSLPAFQREQSTSNWLRVWTSGL